MFPIDDNVTTIAMAIISVISMIVGKLLDNSKHDVHKEINAQSATLVKATELKKKILDKREEINKIKSAILLSVLRSNTLMLKYAVEDEDRIPIEEETVKLEEAYRKAAEELRAIEDKYVILLELTEGAVQEAENEE